MTVTELIAHEQPAPVRTVPWPPEAVDAGAALLAGGIVVNSTDG